MFKKIEKNFQSDFDKFFHDFDKKRSKMPESRIKEVEKHKKIFKKRDTAVDEPDNVIWEGF